MPSPSVHDPRLHKAEPGSEDALLRLIADVVPAQLAYFELPSMRCLFANQAYAAHNGHTPQSVLGLTTEQIVGQEVWETIRPYSRRSAQGEVAQYTREQTLPSGEVRAIEVTLIPFFAQQSTPQGVVVLITDVTERWRAERAVHESAERMRKFAAATEEAIMFHRGGVILDVNDATLRLTGFAFDEVIGQNMLHFVAPEHHDSVREYTRHEREDAYEIAIRHKTGHTIPVEVVGKTMPQDGYDYRTVVMHDLRPRRQAQEREAYLALHDPLTSLPNRRHLLEHLAQLLAQPGPPQVAVLFINLNHFKTVNDSLGQHVGDALLRAVAQRLAQCLAKEEGAFLARTHADEFVLVLAQVASPALALDRTAALVQAMQNPFILGAHTVTMAPSMGVALAPHDGSTADVLLRNAETAMHHAKRTGGGHGARYEADMDTRAMEVLEREHQLRQAIAAQAFVLHYQPQQCLQTGRLVGLEALVRWHHPTRGLVGPDEFIGFAEERGLIAAIGRWVLRETCRQLKAWQDAGLGLVPVAVNLSGLEFSQRNLVQEIADALHAAGIAPRYLEIELTETVLMHHSSQAQSVLRELKALGLGLAVDDFGTGYSSLAYLKRYPIDKLKIDRSFVRDTPHDKDDVAIVTAIVQMGRSLQLRTVAEGVETAAQMALLRQLGCDSVQGFHVAAPLDAQAASRWLGPTGA